MNETKSYVQQSDRDEYRNFCQHNLKFVGRGLPNELWHYTNAEGLVGILSSGKIWATQVACLNDTLEQKYFGDLVHEAIKELRAKNSDKRIEVLLRAADLSLAAREFSTAGHFVACFSEVEDDLGQWRGYGGGQCGYAIGFAPQEILEATQRRQGLLMPMCYDGKVQAHVVNDVLRMAQKYFLDGLSRENIDVEKWAVDFVTDFGNELDVFASVFKHPKFVGEVERRIVTLLRSGEHMALEFRQKQTLLARHLPIDISHTVGDRRCLPITSVYIGPGPSQQVSRISVGDLLLKFGCKDVPVKLSQVPYRVP
jgi:hypothetical protein